MVDFQAICFVTAHALPIIALKDFLSPTAA